MDYIYKEGELIETDPLWVIAGFDSEEEFEDAYYDWYRAQQYE